MPDTSMRRLKPSIVHAPAPRSWAAVAWPPSASAEITARRSVSMLTASVISGALVGFLGASGMAGVSADSSGGAETTRKGPAGNGEAMELSGAGSVLVAIPGCSNSATEAVIEGGAATGEMAGLGFRAGPELHALPPPPNGDVDAPAGDAGEGDGESRGAGAVGAMRDPDAGCVVRTGSPPETLLSNCSMGSNRCA